MNWFWETLSFETQRGTNGEMRPINRARNCVVSELSKLSPGRKCHAHTRVSDNPAAPSVPALSGRAGPPAVIRRVSEIVIDPVNTASRLSLTHVTQKVLERVPAITHGYASSGIIFVVPTSKENACPDGVCAGRSFARTLTRRVSMSRASVGCERGVEATTRLRISAQKIWSGYRYAIAAIAKAVPLSIARFCTSEGDYGESYKPISNHVFSSRHEKFTPEAVC